MKLDYPKLMVSLVLPFAAGAIGSYFTFSNIAGWYATLTKPFFSPPNWLFGPVWTLLYILMGISLYLFWTSKTTVSKKRGYTLFGIQLALNAFWSIAFFGMKSPLNGLIVIVPFWLAILLSYVEFRKVDKNSANLLIPYILWVSFASILNAAVFFLNR